jgi:hypothetical protein
MPPDQPQPKTIPSPDEPDSSFEHGLLVYTAADPLKRGSGCRHCPYAAKHVEGNTQVGP